jgi:glycosyltransferase involved in cell wall biosynthesis
MPTKNRIDQAKIAVACYRRQTWPRRELIILDQGNGGLGKWVDSLGDPTIKYHAMLGLDEPLGSIRNRTIDLSSGDIFCTWDDDDMHHRARIEVAMSALLASKTAAFLLRREWFWMPYERRIGVREPLLYCNALLTWRKAGLRYPPIQKGEDRQAVLQLMKSQPVLLADIPELYLYVAHGSNTVRQSYLETQWNTASDRSQDDAADATLLQLAAAFPISEYANALYAARSPHEVAAH